MKKVCLFLSLLFVLSDVNGLFAQTTIFSESMGTGTVSPEAISNNVFDNSIYVAYTYTGTATTVTTNPSSGYTLTCGAASGGKNVSLTNGGTVFFEVSGINTSSCSSFSLSFGLFKANTAGASSNFIVAVSTDGVTYTNLTYAPALPTGAGTTGWYAETITTGIPATANLRIRFTNISSTNSFKLDDICLMGTCSTVGGTYPPQLSSIVTDACDLAACDCGEGSSEVTLLNSGSYTINPTLLGTKTIQYWGSAAAFPTANAYSGSFTAHVATTTNLNNVATAGCGSGSFIDAITSSGHNNIPQGSTIMMVPYNFCPNAYDLSALCSAFSPIYILYFSTTNTGGGTSGLWSDNHGAGCSTGSGNYGNNGSGTAYVGITFPMAALSPTPAPTFGTQYYTYDKNLEYNGNGAAEGWSGTPSTSSVTPLAASVYTPAGNGTADVCALPIVLPISLIEFTATKATDNIILNWITATEMNNNYFIAEYSFNGIDFIAFNHVKGAGNSNTKKVYNCLFTDNIEGKIPYFRLKQVDFNGNFKYSKIISLVANTLNNSNILAYFQAGNDKVAVKFNLEIQQEISITLYDIAGNKLFENNQLYGKGDNIALMPSPDKGGIYILVYKNENSAPIRKKIIITK